MIFWISLFFFSPYVVKYYGSYFKNTDLWVDINDFHFIFLQWMKWINVILKQWRSYYRGLDKCYSFFPFLLSLFIPVFSSILGHSQYELVTGVEWANQNNRNAIFRVENIVIIELLGVLVCIITFSSLFWMMCRLLKYNKTIIIISISFFLTRLLWNSVVQDQCQI